MKNLGIVLTTVFAVNLAHAQVTSVDLRDGPSQLPAAAQTTTVNVQSGATATALSAPTTYVEASPLVESRAEQLRKQREAAEMNTEMMIVEQLEQDRIEAERRRAQKLSDKLQDDGQPQFKAPVVEERVVIVPEVQPIVETPVQDPVIKEDIQELKSLVQELKTSPAPEVETYSDSSFFISLNLGISEYDAKNVKNNGTLGFTAGMEFADGFIVEGGFTHAEYDVEALGGYNLYGIGHYHGYSYGRPVYEMKQSNVHGAVKYRILNGRISPVVGLLASYTFRDYKAKYNIYDGREASSQSVDMGLYAGANMSVTRNFSVGLDLSYLFNLTNRVDSPYSYSSMIPFTDIIGKPVEESNYYIIGINAALKF